MKKFELTYKPFGQSAILIEWPPEIKLEILHDINTFSNQITTNNIESIVEINSIYSSLLIIYNNNIHSFDKLKTTLMFVYESLQSTTNFEARTWEIPVCYSDEFGPDLDLLSAHSKLAKETIISMHSKTKYAVYGIGFLPGFLYLGGLDKQLQFKRRNNPRLKIPKGSVAIGGSQTGIYPQESPGGWNIIGKTPIQLFDVTKNPPSSIKSGDFIQFKSISKNTFKELELKNGLTFLKLNDD
ncbi:MAG: allophanate hydrolase [Lutibacter sp.]|nr:MAG: allophanate hydrolase [Lutibacter sp.]